MSVNAFELLAQPVKQALWDMQWTELRPIQVEAILTLLTTEDDLLISARTASGKTEAAFLPVISRLHDHPGDSVGAIYVGPLKALINDQFRRLDQLCERAAIPVHRWHGDVDHSKKARVLDAPSGVLLITPESLESFFINRSVLLSRVFGALRFVVIDEIHSLVGRERGLQLRSQLARLRRYTQGEFRLLGLSATIGDAVPHYQSWMRHREPDRVRFISDPGEEKRVQFGIHAFDMRRSKSASDSSAELNRTTDDAEGEFSGELSTEILKQFRGKKNLIFCNSRAKVELVTDGLNAACRKKGQPEEFLAHHGSISRDLRRDAEESMRAARPSTIVCSSTMELGIDIGSVEQVGQIGPCWSVNSFVQRLGRSGRRDGEPHRMRVYLPLEEQSAKAEFTERLYPDLLQAIALMELARRKWVEPPESSENDLSTLVQQILSVLAETGGVKAGPLFTRLAEQGAFHWISPAIFTDVLRSLGKQDWLEQMTEGTLILSPRGERLVRDMDFYSSFVSAQELTVRHDGREIGTLASRFQPLPGNHFLLAGRRWEALEVDLQAGEIRVRPAVGRKSPKFSGGGGEIHPQIRAEMKRALESRDSFSYLNTAGRRFLELARASYRELVSPDSPFIDLGPQGCLWLTWTGTRIQRTLMALAQLAELECRDHRLALQFRDEPASIVQSLVDISSRLEDDNALTQGFTIAPWRKFDACLSEALLLKPFVSEFLDLPGARRALEHARQALSRIPSNGAPPPQIVSKVIVAPSKETVSEFAPASRMGVRPNEGDTPAPTEANATMTIVPSTAGNEVTAAESRRVRVGRASRIATKVSASQLAECEFVALDLETTGLDQRSRIVEIGAIRFRLREEPVVEFHSLIDPEVPIPASATRVHGISNEMVAGRPTIAEALPRFADYLSERPVIIAAHNARFDLSFLQAAAREIQIAFPIAPYIDTLELARQALPQLPNHRLVTVVAYLGSRTVAAHRSLADANHVRFVLERLLLDLKVDPFVVR